MMPPKKKPEFRAYKDPSSPSAEELLDRAELLGKLHEASLISSVKDLQKFVEKETDKDLGLEMADTKDAKYGSLGNLKKNSSIRFYGHVISPYAEEDLTIALSEMFKNHNDQRYDDIDESFL